MPMDFSVIIRVRQQFGDDDSALEQNAPFVGAAKDYEFLTPNVERQAEAILLFQSLGVTFGNNGLTVNGQPVFGGIPFSTELFTAASVTGLPDGDNVSTASFELPVWNANVLLVSPGVLRSSGANVLRIEARDQDGGSDGKLDDFIIDNVVIIYRTRPDGSVFEQPDAFQ